MDDRYYDESADYRLGENGHWETRRVCRWKPGEFQAWLDAERERYRPLIVAQICERINRNGERL